MVAAFVFLCAMLAFRTFYDRVLDRIFPEFRISIRPTRLSFMIFITTLKTYFLPASTNAWILWNAAHEFAPLDGPMATWAPSTITITFILDILCKLTILIIDWFACKCFNILFRKLPRTFVFKTIDINNLSVIDSGFQMISNAICTETMILTLFDLPHIFIHIPTKTNIAYLRSKSPFLNGLNKEPNIIVYLLILFHGPRRISPETFFIVCSVSSFILFNFIWLLFIII